MKAWFLLLMVCSTQLLASEPESTNDDGSNDWGDDWAEETAYQLSHELSYSFAGIIQSDSVNRENSVANEFRYRSEFVYPAESYTLNLEYEVIGDFLLDDEQLSLRQLNLIKPVGSTTDLKIGRQVITWGTGDLLFLNDLFSKDWQSFFNGRDNRYLKPPVDAIRLSQYHDSVNWEVAFLPDFVPDNTPTGERYSLFLPGSGITQPTPNLNFFEPEKAEIAARLFQTVQGVEWALYGYTGFFKSPSKLLANGSLSYAEMDAFGASIRLPFAGGLFNAEIVAYQSKEDPDGSNPLINNSQNRLLLGFETELVKNTTIAIQAYLEQTRDRDNLIANLLPGQSIPDEHRTLYTMRLTHLALQQKLVNSVMYFYSPSDRDYYLRYSSSYKFSDNWKTVLGVNLLDGKHPETFLAQMQDNSNAFLRVQYHFQ